MITPGQIWVIVNNKASITSAERRLLLQRKYSTRDYAALDKKLAHLLRLEIEKLERRKISITATSLVSALGYGGTFRHNRYRLPLSVSVVEKFKRSNLSARQVKLSAAQMQVTFYSRTPSTD